VKSDKVRLSDIAPGTCFKQGKTEKKKLSDGRVVSVDAKKRTRFSTPKNDPLVSVVSCNLSLIGTGLRKHPEYMVEMGSGRPKHVKDQKLK
jgi:hypothetical protein